MTEKPHYFIEQLLDFDDTFSPEDMSRIKHHFQSNGWSISLFKQFCSQIKIVGTHSFEVTEASSVIKRPNHHFKQKLDPYTREKIMKDFDFLTLPVNRNFIIIDPEIITRPEACLVKDR